MHNEDLQFIVNTIAKGDTTFAEEFFRKPGGRKYLENITLILINTLPYKHEEKEELYFAFVQVLNKIEKRIKRQKDGQRILEDVFS
ncbi:hypothetical protein [Aridibaculum aurantiacum]|uniref:hypothetical protein n=1 Tax=Aridibaculum aurantiacum TaxID=2810307 RepID=UPI001A96FB41|nr:hypothetical protein [Aridibaculum aurantiacum]